MKVTVAEDVRSGTETEEVFNNIHQLDGAYLQVDKLSRKRTQTEVAAGAEQRCRKWR